MAMLCENCPLPTRALKGHVQAHPFLAILAVFFAGAACLMGAMGAAAARRPARGTREGHSRGNSVLATMSLWGAVQVQLPTGSDIDAAYTP